MVTPSGSCPVGSPAAPAPGASENGHYVDWAPIDLGFEVAQTNRSAKVIF